MIHCGFVGIIGLPNVGKSTFLNYVLKEKVSIVSHKPQTTRQSVSGVLSTDEYQLIFFDAPGLVTGGKGLFSFLSAEVDKIIEKSDHILVLMSNDQEASELLTPTLEKLKRQEKPVSTIFTKSDLQATPFVMERKQAIMDSGAHFLNFSIHRTNDAAQKAELDEFLRKLALSMPQETQPLYDPEMISLDATRNIVSEFIREQCFLQLGQEIPFSLGVKVNSYKKEKGILRIDATIFVEKDNHKGIVIGKKGAQLQEIGTAARKSIEDLLGEKIFLGLHVVCKKNWMKNDSMMKEMGYNVDKK